MAEPAYLWWMKEHGRKSVHTIVFGPLVIERVFRFDEVLVSVVVKHNSMSAVLDALAGTDMRERRGMELVSIYAIREPSDDLAYDIRSLYDLRESGTRAEMDLRACRVIGTIEVEGEVLFHA